MFHRAQFWDRCCFLYIYINDLPNCTDADFILFADDTTAFKSNLNTGQLQSQADIINSDLQQWIISNQMSLNSDKTQQLLFSLRVSSCDATAVKFLGILLGQGLTWEAYIDPLMQ